MINKRLFRSALHEHADPVQRVLGAAELPPDSDELARLLSTDPAAEVRAAAARRCTELAVLAAAWETEIDPEVRTALVPALASVLSAMDDGTRAAALLQADGCDDAIRGEVARRTQDGERRRIAIASIRDEEPLIVLAQAAGHAETRMAAAERVQTLEGLRKLADATRNKDRGVSRLARQRIDAMENRAGRTDAAEAILTEVETLTSTPGPILTAVVELDRRWQALDIGDDADRRARWEAARQTLQARFAREHDDQRTRTRFERKSREWIAALAPPAAPEALSAMRAELAALREEAAGHGGSPVPAALDEAERRFAQWELEHHALAGAEALAVEAEQLAASTSIDNAKLPERWQALARATRSPALTQRFETALMIIEQRRLAQIGAAQQQANVVRQQLHHLLHTAEQALDAGEMHAARAAAAELRSIKTAAGPLPKPTAQRLGRVVQQLSDLERWESFGQHNARIQLCERAEALAAQSLDAARLALDVQKLRGEWKLLDQQHAGVPKALWERFDGACEKAYAPAARHFAEQAAQRKQARKQRDEFIAAAAAHAPALLGEPRDMRAIERWLRETERAWREGDLGSVDPGAWKKLDARLKAALSPLRDALSASRDQAKAGRQALVAEALALAAKAMERDAPSQVKALQARWQVHAKANPLAQRDERTLWEEFRAACDAVFAARQNKRKEEDDRKHGHRRALEETCAQLEQLAQAAGKDDAELRRSLRELQEQWKHGLGRPDPALASLESRFKQAKTAVEALLSTRTRASEAAIWQTLAAKERICDELDALADSNDGTDDVATRSADAQARWAALPALSAAWEKKMAARRDAALKVLSEPAAVADHRARVEAGAAARRDGLLELEMMLGLGSPAELQAHRLALQVKQLRDRFKGEATPTTVTAGERLLAWCAQPGVADAGDRQRAERAFSAMGQAR